MERIRVILILGALLAVSCRDGGDYFPADCWEDNSYPGYDLPGRTDEGTPSYDNGVPVCIPQCDGKTCGPDGCSWSCGNCVEGTWCNEGTCVPFGCTPNCSGKVCGPDDCGGSCGNCNSGYSCSSAGMCIEVVPPSSEGTGDCSDDLDNDKDGLTDCSDPGCYNAEACEQCDPNCINRVCGPDGCGGSCGNCGTGLTCNASGQCIQQTPVYTVTCKFTGYVINMTEPGTKWSCPHIWSFATNELDIYGRLPLFARNTGTADSALETTTKSLSMKEIPWTLPSDPAPSSIFAIVGGEAVGVCDSQYPLTYKVIVPANSGQAVTANCGAN